MKRKIQNLLLLDQASLLSLTSKAWLILSGPILVWLITKNLSLAAQGYFYTFKSLLELQIFVELGMGTVLIHFISDARAQCSLGEDSNYVSDNESPFFKRWANICKYGIKWYALGSCAFVFLVGLGGFLFLKSKSSQLEIGWVGPWFALILTTSINIALLPFLTILEGSGFVKNVYWVRFVTALLRTGGTICALYMGMNLWALAFGVLISTAYGIFYISRFFLPLFKKIFQNECCDDSWKTNMWKMQKKIIMTWIMGYFSLYTFVPFTFYIQGPEIAAKLGITLTICGMVSQFCSAWLQPKTFMFGQFIAKKDFNKLHQYVKSLFFSGLSLSLVIGLVVAVAAGAIKIYDFSIKERFLDLIPTLFFVAANMLNSITFPLTAYLRAFKEEPLFYVAILNCVLILFSNTFVNKIFGIYGVSLSTFMINIVIVFFTFKIFFKKKELCWSRVG